MPESVGCARESTGLVPESEGYARESKRLVLESEGYARESTGLVPEGDRTYHRASIVAREDDETSSPGGLLVIVIPSDLAFRRGVRRDATPDLNRAGEQHPGRGRRAAVRCHGPLTVRSGRPLGRPLRALRTI